MNVNKNFKNQQKFETKLNDLISEISVFLIKNMNKKNDYKIFRSRIDNIHFNHHFLKINFDKKNNVKKLKYVFHVIYEKKTMNKNLQLMKNELKHEIVFVKTKFDANIDEEFSYKADIISFSVKASSTRKIKKKTIIDFIFFQRIDVIKSVKSSFVIKKKRIKKIIKKKLCIS